MLSQSGQIGSILWIIDGVTPEANKVLAKQSGSLPVRILAPLPSGSEMQSVLDAAKAIGGDVTPITPDDADVAELARNTHFAETSDNTLVRQWHESGFALVPIIALISALWFRRGNLGAFIGAGRGES
jgi:Ca-activated chloride channel family protein